MGSPRPMAGPTVGIAASIGRATKLGSADAALLASTLCLVRKWGDVTMAAEAVRKNACKGCADIYERAEATRCFRSSIIYADCGATMLRVGVT